MTFEKLKFKKINNARDLGGLPAEGGKRVKYGKLIRSSRLYKLPKITVKRLKEYGLTAIVDLRTETERNARPATKITGVKYHALPILTSSTAGITADTSAMSVIYKESKRLKREYETTDNYMTSMYTEVLFGEESRPVIKKFFDIILEEDGCVLWLCNQGKDRTGILAMLLEGLLGIDEKTIIADYVASAKFLRPKRALQKIAITIVPSPLKLKSILYALVNVKPQYIAGAIEAIKQKYGGITEYCKQVLEITEEEIKTLKDKYLE